LFAIVCLMKLGRI